MTTGLLERAIGHHQAGEYGPARDLYCEVLQSDPLQVDALHYLGLLTHQVGQSELAVQLMEKARLMGMDNPVHENNLGEVYRALGRTEEAEGAFRKALLLNPTLVAAHTNLGSLLRDQGDLDGALRSYKQALRLQPKDPITINNIGNIYKDTGHVRLAAEHYLKALSLRPNYAAAETNHLFCLAYDDHATLEEVFLAHRSWGIKQQAPKPKSYRNLRVPDKVLRIAYLSGDFRAHAVARFMEPILANHDSKAVKAYCYAEVRVPDSVTKRLQSLAMGWCSTLGMTDEQLAEHIRQEEIDIIVDLAGHTSGNRLRALVLHPAPIQVTYLGYPNTTGLSAIDARLTEAVADPPGADKYYTERLVRLSEGFCCFALPNDAPDVRPLPALQLGYVTFGSPHNLAKLNDRVLSIWADILQRLPTARLRLFRAGLTGTVRDRLLQRFVDRGIAPDRLEIENTSSESVGYAGYLNALGGVDIMLDAFPANAGTTACEALAMGVPIVSLLGDRFYGRLSASLLTRVGLTDWVAESQEQYVEFAVNYAADVPGLAKLRGELRERVKTRLGDGLRFTRALELAYRDLWKEWCQGGIKP